MSLSPWTVVDTALSASATVLLSWRSCPSGAETGEGRNSGRGKWTAQPGTAKAQLEAGPAPRQESFPFFLGIHARSQTGLV